MFEGSEKSSETTSPNSCSVAERSSLNAASTGRQDVGNEHSPVPFANESRARSPRRTTDEEQPPRAPLFQARSDIRRIIPEKGKTLLSPFEYSKPSTQTIVAPRLLREETQPSTRPLLRDHLPRSQSSSTTSTGIATLEEAKLLHHFVASLGPWVSSSCPQPLITTSL